MSSEATIRLHRLRRRPWTNRPRRHPWGLFVTLVILALTAILASRPSRAPAADEAGTPGAGPPATAPAGAQKYELKFDLKPGQRWDFELRNQSEMKQQVTTNGQPQTVETASNTLRKGTLEVLSVKDGTATAVKVTFDKASITEGHSNGQNVSAPFPLAGKTVTLRKDEAGKVTHDGGDLDAATTGEVENLMEADKSTFPPHPVAVGDEWDADTRKMAQQFQLGLNDQVSVKCKLLRIGTAGGRKTADISIAGTVRKAAQGIDMNVTLGGVTQIDLATGEPVRSDVVGKITTKGTIQANGPSGPVPVQISGDGKVEVHQTVTLAGEGAAGAAGAGTGTGAAVAATAPAGPASAPAAPAGPPDALPAAAPGAAFLGTFKGETLTAEFHRENFQPPGGLSGTLSIGDKKYPAEAHAEGQRLVGSFTSDGHSFDFTASLEGDTLTLKTGSTSYTLKKPEPKKPENPLDTAGARNPLDGQGR